MENNNYDNPYGQQNDSQGGPYQYGQQNGPQGGPYDYNGGYHQPPQRSGGSGLAIASLVLGIISLILMCGINIITAIVGIILGAIYIARGNQERRVMAIVGLVLSIVSIVLFIVLMIVGVSLLSSGLYDSIMQEYYYNLMVLF